MGDQNKEYNEAFIKPIKKIGPATIFLAGLLSLLPVIYLGIRYDATPPIDKIFEGWLSVVSAYGAFYIVEPISYFATLGIAGTYMSFLSGNIGNMRVPSAAIAQEVIGVDGSTPKGELVGTLGIAGSIVTNIIVLTIIAVAGNVIVNNLPQIIRDSLAYILPSLFGAMIIFFGIKSIRSIFFGLGIAYILMGLLKVKAAWIVILVSIFGTVLINYFLYKKTGKL